MSFITLRTSFCKTEIRKFCVVLLIVEANHLITTIQQEEKTYSLMVPSSGQPWVQPSASGVHMNIIMSIQLSSSLSTWFFCELHSTRKLSTGLLIAISPCLVIFWRGSSGEPLINHVGRTKGVPHHSQHSTSFTGSTFFQSLLELISTTSLVFFLIFFSPRGVDVEGCRARAEDASTQKHSGSGSRGGGHTLVDLRGIVYDWEERPAKRTEAGEDAHDSARLAAVVEASWTRCHCWSHRPFPTLRVDDVELPLCYSEVSMDFLLNWVGLDRELTKRSKGDWLWGGM
jgi:hypothetical protein